MLINNVDISTHGAKVEKKMFDHSAAEGSGKGVLTIRLLFEGRDRNEVHKNISNFMAIDMKECTIKFKNISNYFNSSYMSHSIEDTEFDGYLFMELEMEYIEVGAEVTHNFVSQSTITAAGNLDANIQISVTSRINLVDCVISGVSDDPIKIKNLKANTPVIINGNDGLITEGGKNKFLDVELWEFPRLKPGRNTVAANKENITIEIKYKPRWR